MLFLRHGGRSQCDANWLRFFKLTKLLFTIERNKNVRPKHAEQALKMSSYFRTVYYRGVLVVGVKRITWTIDDGSISTYALHTMTQFYDSVCPVQQGL